MFAGSWQQCLVQKYKNEKAIIRFSGIEARLMAGFFCWKAIFENPFIVYSF